jgi:hypothetical protein
MEPFMEPLGARQKVEQDIEKIGAHLAAGAVAWAT